VNGYDQVHQIECRWQPHYDFSPIASSFPVRSTATTWFSKLKPAVRPATPNASAGTPEVSMVYLTFDDGTAAVIWRHWDLNAIPLQDGGSRRPLVARILVGSQQLLKPEVAMSLCRTGIRGVAGPLPGQVNPGTALPPITANQLSELAESSVHGLDDRACKEAGLGRLIAAALRDNCTALAVQLPAHEMGDPAKGPQVPLLWGLWRTTQPLLADIDDPASGFRNWSFSTYEPATDASDTRGLADIVFRAHQPRQQPQLVRRETPVLPRDKSVSAVPDNYDVLGASLAGAYGALGGPELGRRLEEAVLGNSTLADRLIAAGQALQPFVPPACDVGAPSSPRATPHAEQMERLPEVTGDFGDLLQLEPLAGARPAVPMAAESAWPPEATRPAELDSPLPAGQAVRRADPGQETLKARRNAGGRRRRGQASEESMADLLDRLGAGPDSPGFAQAVDALRGAPPASRPADRAAARESMARRDWYIPALVSYDPWHVEELLLSVFMLTVIPDLAEDAVRAEVADWAFHRDAPAAVIRALTAAAHQAGSAQSSALAHALTPALYRRWLAEHAIYVGPVARTTAPLRSEPGRPKRLWQFFLAGDRSAAAASILAWLCLLLVIALVASLLL
jgi:hypothetical protein